MSTKKDNSDSEKGGVIEEGMNIRSDVAQIDPILANLDPKVESRLRLKMDLCLVPTVALLYLFCFIDRANIGNAKIAGFETDIGIDPTSHNYNIVLTCFYISYIIFEVPSNICCKWIGPGWFIPFITLCFGAVSVGYGYVENMTQACVVRFLLGVFEAGMLPGIAYYLSRWYKRAELAFRLSLYMVMAPLAGAFGALLASAILTLDHFGNVESWRMIFVIEGIVTMALAVVGFFTLTDRPETARWLTEEEKLIVIARVQSERVGSTVVLDRMNVTKLLHGMLNPVTVGIAILFFLNNVTVQGLAFFTPTIVGTIFPDKTTVHKQLLSAPPSVAGAICLLVACYYAWKFDRRVIFLVLSAPCIIIGYIIFTATESTDGTPRYVACFFVASTAYFLGPLSTAVISANVESDTARSSGIGLAVMAGNVGGLASTWVWLPSDGPRYPIGNGINLASGALVFIISLAMLLWMNADNKKRDAMDVEAELEGKTQLEIENLDWHHPEFKWRP